MKSCLYLLSLLYLAGALSGFERLVFRVVFTQDTERFHSDELETTPFKGKVALAEENNNYFSDGFLCIAEKIEEIMNECTSTQSNNVRTHHLRSSSLSSTLIKINLTLPIATYCSREPFSVM